MEHWRRIWREGLCPQFTDAGLEALDGALGRNDDQLLQGATTSPPGLQSLENHAIEAACAIGYCGWRGEDLGTVGQVDAFFADVCRKADEAMGEAGACRQFLDWFDQTPRDAMRAELLREVRLALARRRHHAA